uniref:Uncharacterized protein n=1 Tax=Strongyloides papillosus TaxID=174720 RepID=A0A0N5C5J4_STREA
MKYLVSFYTLFIAIFISIIETRHLAKTSFAGDQEVCRRKWESLSKKCWHSIEIAKKATKLYNKKYNTNYKYRKLALAEKAVEPPLRIRIFFIACTKKSDRHSKNKQNNRNSKRQGRTCDHFRVKFEKVKSGRPIISVRNLNYEKETGTREQETTTKRPKIIKEKLGRNQHLEAYPTGRK